MTLETIFSGLRRIRGECEWTIADLPTEIDVSVRARLSRIISDIESDGVGIAPQLVPFEGPVGCRPPGHNRTFYRSLGKGFGYIGIKGTEPLLTGPLCSLAASGLPLALRPGGQTSIDFFPTVEHKVPLALTVAEARAEAQISERLYRDYCTKYGETPFLPLPLAVIRWPKELLDSFWEILSPLLSTFAREICLRLLREGACCYLYYYPVAPFPRVRHLAASLKQAHRDRLALLTGYGSPTLVIDRWVSLFTRLLALGYVAAAPSRAVTGQAVQAQNTVVGGGFLDLDSVRAIDEIAGASELRESLALSLVHMSSTIATYLFEAASEHPSPTNGLDVMSSHFFQARLSAAIERESREQGTTFHTRLQNLPPFGTGLDDLMRLAEAAQGEPKTASLAQLLEGRREPA